MYLDVQGSILNEDKKTLWESLDWENILWWERWKNIISYSTISQQHEKYKVNSTWSNSNINV